MFILDIVRRELENAESLSDDMFSVLEAVNDISDMAIELGEYLGGSPEPDAHVVALVDFAVNVMDRLGVQPPQPEASE